MRFLAVLSGVGVLTLLLSMALFDVTSFQTVRADDDHSDFRSAATHLGIGAGKISGKIDETSLFFDVDYFTFEAQRGLRYTFSLDMVSVTDANVLVINSVDRGAGVAEGQTTSWDGQRKQVEWVARTTDTYFLEVFGAQGTPNGPVFLGDYSLSADADSLLEDRHSESSADATPIAIGNQYQGSISPWPNQPMYVGSVKEDYDHDYFSFRANRGIRYTIGVALDSRQGVEISVGNQAGGVAASNEGIGSTLDWIAPDTAIYYVILSGSTLVREPVDNYTLEVSADLSLEDRHSGSREGATPINFGNQHQGAISPEDDSDYFSFQAVRGIKYDVNVAVNTGEGAKISISDSAGKSEANNGGVGSSLEWIARSTAVYYAVVSASPLVRSPVGAYVLEVAADGSLEDRHSDSGEGATQVYFGTPQGGSISPPNDVDFFYFQAIRGVEYNLTVELGTVEGVSLSLVRPEDGAKVSTSGSGTALEWIAPLTGTYFAVVNASTRINDVIGTYSLEITADVSLEDRFSDNREGATAIRMGIPQQGAISPGDDQDYFLFNAKKGVEYDIEVDSASYAGINIAVARPIEGVEISNNSIGNRLVWIAPSDGTYYVVVSNSGLPLNPAGPYSLKVNANTAWEDRHGESREDATSISFATVYLGAISPEDDLDYFSFQARRGVKYHIDAGLDALAAISIVNSDEGIETSNDSLGPSLDWTAPSDATYFVVLAASTRVDDSVGSYALEIKGDTTTEDRHSNLNSAATPISFGNREAGAISPADDEDRFSFPATRGVRYTFELTYGTAEAVSLSVVEFGATEGARASNYGEDATVTWLSPTDDTYIITVSAAPQAEDPVGTYFLKVTADSSLKDRHANDLTGATQIGYGNTIGGSISPVDDIDTFSFHGERGATYQVEVQTGTDHPARFSVTNPDSSYTESNYGAGDTLMITAPVSGAYYVIVSAMAPAAAATTIYEVIVTPDQFSPTIEPIDSQTNPRSSAFSGITLGVENRMASPGGTVLVPIMLDKANDISGLAFSLSYDSTVIEVVAVQQGSLLAPAKFTYSAKDPGMIRFGFSADEPISGHGSAAVVEFRVIGDLKGGTGLALSRRLVSDSYSRPLPVELTDGELTVGFRIVGDGDGDGAVSALDALIALRMSHGLTEVDLALDMDGDGKITGDDARQILAMAGPGREV